MTRRTILTLVLASGLLGWTLSSPAAGTAKGTWTGLRQMMGAEEFHAAGLDKLSPQELQRLDQWLKQFVAYDSEQIIKQDKDIQALQQVPVRRRIAGHFSGWSGDTIFTLDNGEVWKQRLSGRYFANLESPEVEIRKNMLGFYEMRIVKTGRKIGVTRLK